MSELLRTDFVPIYFFFLIFSADFLDPFHCVPCLRCSAAETARARLIGRNVNKVYGDFSPLRFASFLTDYRVKFIRAIYRTTYPDLPHIQ